MTTSARPASAAPKYKRSFRNYLLDARFQLKWTGYLIGVAIVISALLGGFLYKTNNEVISKSNELVEESAKNSDLVRMQIKEQYADAPELAESFSAGAKEHDLKLKGQRDQIHQQQRRMIVALIASLFTLVVMIGLVGIYITHKLVGPIYKMKMLLRQVGEGKLNFQGRLRKGDELQDFFEVFATMVENLKDRQRREVAELESAMVAARSSGASEDAIAKIELVRDEMRAALEK